MPKKSGFYSQVPAVPVKKIAGLNPVGPSPVIGSGTPGIVDTHPAVLHGIEQHTFRHPSVKGAHGWGHVAKEKHGHHRLSGHVGAHMIGKRFAPK